MRISKRRSVAMLLATSVALTASAALACSLAFVNDRPLAKIVVRSMDLPITFPEKPKFVVFPRGAERSSLKVSLPGVSARIDGVGPNALSWTSRYGSAVVVSFNMAASDGMNEKGLAAHLLALDASAWEAPDNRPELPITHWAQYVLDTYATVKEVVEAHERGEFRIVPVTSSDLGYRHISYHLAVQDPTGDSAIIEYVGGKPLIHHGPQYDVVTNDPTYDEMLAKVKQMEGSGAVAKADDDSAEFRFYRLSSFKKLLPDPQSEREAVAAALTLIRGVQLPFRDPKRTTPGDFWGAVQTDWVTAADLTNKVYYFSDSQSPSVFWLDLSKADFSRGAPVLIVDATDPDVAGDVLPHLKPAIGW